MGDPMAKKGLPKSSPDACPLCGAAGNSVSMRRLDTFGAAGFWACLACYNRVWYRRKRGLPVAPFVRRLPLGPQ
jgi:hypothetical protein